MPIKYAYDGVVIEFFKKIWKFLIMRIPVSYTHLLSEHIHICYGNNMFVRLISTTLRFLIEGLYLSFKVQSCLIRVN